MTTLGPYGQLDGTKKSLNCPDGYYISSFVGKSAERLDLLGFRCRPEGDMYADGTVIGEFGGFGGVGFDELALSKGARPIIITCN